MSKLTSKIAIPVILAGIFAIAIFVSIDYENLNVTFYVIMFLLAIFVFFFGFATGQELSSPVKRLLERATDLSKGNLSSRVYLETKDELAELGRVFNQIAEELELRRAEQENTEKSVGLKVRARTQELEETINALEQKVRNRTSELERLISESSKIQQDLKNKEMETGLLKKELDCFRRKSGKVPKKQE